MPQSQAGLFKGTLLVAGTTIGGGMLALPVLTALGGFLPSLAIFLLCWFFMTCTGLLFLEICLWSQKETNMISMAEKTLGFPGKAIAWFLYLSLFYCLALAYVVGCGHLLADFFGGILTAWQGSLLFVALFGPLVYLGTRLVGKINLLLMFGLMISFLAFVMLGFRYVDTELLNYRNWWFSLGAMPIAFISFAYQGIIPTLTTYFHHDPKKTRIAIICGTLIPLVVYVIWEWLILGIVPVFGQGGLVEAMENGDNAVQPLKEFLDNPWVYGIGQAFAFFAMVTSFLGVSLGLVDFLADGFKVQKTRLNQAILCLAVFVPPLIFAYSHPHVFLQALDFAGGIGSALLLGVFPIVIVWIGRYRKGLSSAYRFPGGKIALSLLFLFVCFELVFELTKALG